MRELLDAAAELSDRERLEAVAGIAEQVDCGRLPRHQRDRVMRWRDQARSAATAAEGPHNSDGDEEEGEGGG